MLRSRKYCLSIAGFDSSGGAGLLTDIKTFEAQGFFGLSACITYQNDEKIEGLEFSPEHQLTHQLEVLFDYNEVSAVKIGLTKNLKVLDTVVNFIRSHDKSIPIVWDPVLSSTSGFVFHSGFEPKEFADVCFKITIVTPNVEELMAIYSEAKTKKKAIDKMTLSTNPYVKSFKQSKDSVTDRFIFNNKTIEHSNIKLLSSKHGTGCIFSSALCANLAKGTSMEESARLANAYVNEFLTSEDGRLGLHTH
jgi:hydroxymethylpyrimidine/phosphomethylpyrimidine kinase